MGLFASVDCALGSIARAQQLIWCVQSSNNAYSRSEIHRTKELPSSGDEEQPAPRAKSRIAATRLTLPLLTELDRGDGLGMIANEYILPRSHPACVPHSARPSDFRSRAILQG
jgi:hypothetical protein